MAEEVISPEEQVKQLQNELAGVYQTNAALQEEIEKLSGGQPIASDSSLLAGFKTSSFELDGQKYGFNYPATKHKGQFITHLEIIAEEVLQRLLISIGAGIIKKLK